jgi:hypothetical protein
MRRIIVELLTSVQHIASHVFNATILVQLALKNGNVIS